MAAQGQEGLNCHELFLLEWLSKGGGSLGECQGEALTTLINRGLAEVSDIHLGAWAWVSLTGAGCEAISKEPR